MTEGINETTVVSKKMLDDGSYYESVTKLTSYISEMNPIVKRCLIGYGVIVLACYTVYNYTDGKNALISYRSKNSAAQPMEEWKAIRDGIHSYDNFWSSIFFPWSISEKIMPSIILRLNPKIEKKNYYLFQTTCHCGLYLDLPI